MLWVLGLRVRVWGPGFKVCVFDMITVMEEEMENKMDNLMGSYELALTVCRSMEVSFGRRT